MFCFEFGGFVIVAVQSPHRFLTVRAEGFSSFSAFPGVLNKNFYSDVCRRWEGGWQELMGAGVCLSSLVYPSSGFHPSSRNKSAGNQWYKEPKI